MWHFNKECKSAGFGLLRPLEWIMPECYMASSLNDFINDEDKIKSTKKILPMGCYFNGLAFIKFSNKLIFSHEYEEENKSRKYYLSDLVNTVELRDIHEDPCKHIRKLDEDEIGLLLEQKSRPIYEPIVIYKPSSKGLWLLDFKTEGPATPDSHKDLEEQLDRAKVQTV